MTELLKPEPGESIYDPTCGSAGMLISSISYLRKKGKEWRNVSLYGQEVNALTCAIGRMNLFLHGVEDFQIVNGDTLVAPAFIEKGKLQQFDIAVANPPYSISQWDRTAFASDKYGRNFLGVPNQNRADFAFIQHILASLKPISGRCAILLPHGVLNRQEEQNMREGLIKRDLLECVIGVGKNLFYNSPMEACIMICRTQKPHTHKGRVLFIDGRRFVTREGTESFVTLAQIHALSKMYSDFEDVPDTAYVANIAEIAGNDYSLAINRYVTHELNGQELVPSEDLLADWIRGLVPMRMAIQGVVDALGGDQNE